MLEARGTEMGGRDAGNGSTQRDQTDESLRTERERADASVAENSEVMESEEDEADEMVRVARQRADQIVQAAREAADRERSPQSSANAASTERERTQADVLLESERSAADAVLEHERAKRKRYLADFLAVEREATDQDLLDERVHSDTAIAGRDELLANVSHDLRSLLGGLSLNTEMLIAQAPEGAAGEPIRKYGATSQRMVARMNRLINDLLDLTSIEAGQLALVPERLDVAKLLRDTIEAFGPIAAARRITLTADSSALPLQARLDGGRILQVLANLVGNAIKFTPPEGRVSIRLHTEGSELRFAVSDTGIGIPKDALQGVFERFRQVSKDRRGLGLGLHISSCIAAAHGGRMWVESELGVGSTFHLALPAALAEGSV
jgi:signal transduction histidine kinase